MSGLAAPDASPRWGERLRWTLSDASVIAGTNLTHWVLTHWVLTHWVLTHWVRNLAAVLNLTLYPIVMVVLFGWVLGSAMNVAGGGDYREFLMPGMFSQTMAMGVMTTMTVVSLQTARGVTDRYRSMPISRSGVVLGRAFADIVNSALELLILLACGLAAAHDAGQHLRVPGAPAGLARDDRGVEPAVGDGRLVPDAVRQPWMAGRFPGRRARPRAGDRLAAADHACLPVPVGPPLPPPRRMSCAHLAGAYGWAGGVFARPDLPLVVSRSPLVVRERAAWR
ncbi:hypothetical protein ACFYOK_02075 [Microbispora bryophytorum]|uniref:hypothetical protein n=1 Tax=Microbispora bryophytorum TaxID=1460882 RepID=UPI0033E94AB9